MHGGSPFIPVAVKKSKKYENPFNPGDIDYLFPYFDEHDPYEAAKDEVLRTKWLEESKVLGPAFKPAAKEKSLEIAGKKNLIEILE